MLLIDVLDTAALSSRPARVFISCGLSSHEEEQAAIDVRKWFTKNKYDPYVAIQAQTILDINCGTIGELKSSDLYVMINFRREKIGVGEHRGSLFTNQELAIAYALGFDKILILNQTKLKREGLLAYMAANTPEFSEFDRIIPTLEKAIKDAGWTSQYSRHLCAVELSATRSYVGYTYVDRPREVRIFRAAIQNRRPDKGAIRTIARLVSLQDEKGKLLQLPLAGQLKATGYPGYEQTIRPNDTGEFDILAIARPFADEAGPCVYLNSAVDLSPVTPLIQGQGNYYLTFQVFADGFPELRFSVDLELKANALDSTVKFGGTPFDSGC